MMKKNLFVLLLALILRLYVRRITRIGVMCFGLPCPIMLTGFIRPEKRLRLKFSSINMVFRRME